MKNKIAFLIEKKKFDISYENINFLPEDFLIIKTSTAAICGSDFSLADIILVTCLDWALAYKFELPVNTSEYHNKMIKREAYKKAVQINYK